MSEWGNKDYANNMPKYLDHNYPGNTTVYMVNPSRIANSGAIGESVTHQGWVKVYPGQGPITTITVSGDTPGSKTYTNEVLTISGANTSPASANLVVSGSGASQKLSVTITNPGSGYTSATTVSASSANNDSLTFTVSGGGRFGRNQTETLVALSEIPVVTANSAKAFFKD